MPEDFATNPLTDRLYAIKNVATGRYAALTSVGGELYTLSSSVEDEARWDLAKTTDPTYTLKNRKHDVYATVTGAQANETVKGNASSTKTTWTITPTPDHATTKYFYIVSNKDAYWSLPSNASAESDDNLKIPITVKVTPDSNTWQFVKV